MNRAQRRREQRGAARRNPSQQGDAEGSFTVTLFSDVAVQHVHVFVDGFLCDHAEECEDAADWWRGMRPAPWNTPPFVVETVMSCGCGLLVTADPEAFKAFELDVASGAVAAVHPCTGVSDPRVRCSRNAAERPV